jgi:phosphoesterase RecJ-like protein
MNPPLQSLLQRLQQAQNPVITTHINPDGDALGSSLGLWWALRRAGIQATVMVPNPYPDFYQWMPGTEHLVVFEEDPARGQALLHAADFIFALDYNDFPRVGEAMGAVLEHCAGFKWMIDHHPQPNPKFDAIYSDTSKSSTCQMVGEMLQEAQWFQHLHAEGATCLFTGIMTDTGSFRFPSTSPHTHRMAADLKEAGADQALIYDKVMDAYTPSRLKLLGAALGGMQLMPEYRTAVLSLSQSQLLENNYRKGDTEGFVNYGLSMSGFVFSAIFIEHEDRVKVSFRSKGDFDVNQFSRSYFGGGGHRNAAGGVYFGTLSEALTAFQTALNQTHP